MTINTLPIIGYAIRNSRLVEDRQGTTLEIPAETYEVIAVIPLPDLGGVVYITNKPWVFDPTQMTMLDQSYVDCYIPTPLPARPSNKKIKTLNRTRQSIPTEMQHDWSFKTWNIGTALYSSYYGILCNEDREYSGSPHLGINVEAFSSFNRLGSNAEKKVANALAAHVAAADPETVGALIDQNETLAARVDFLERQLGNALANRQIDFLK